MSQPEQRCLILVQSYEKPNKAVKGRACARESILAVHAPIFAQNFIERHKKQPLSRKIS